MHYYIVVSAYCIPRDLNHHEYAEPRVARSKWKKKRQSPLSRRQMAVISSRSALAAILQQRDIFCTNKNQGQAHSSKLGNNCLDNSRCPILQSNLFLTRQRNQTGGSPVLAVCPVQERPVAIHVRKVQKSGAWLTSPHQTVFYEIRGQASV